MRTSSRTWMLWIVIAGFLLPPLFAKGDSAKGKEIFARCAMCHGNSGEGKPAIAKMYGVQMKALSSKEVQSMSDADLTKILSQGKGKMKPLGLTAPEIEDVIAFLRTLKK